MNELIEGHSGLKVLLVDDSTEVVTLYREWLEGDGYQVVTAEDGMEAIPLAQKWRPDIAILDYRMPGMTGAELAEYLLAQPETRDTLVVLFTEYNDTEEDALDAGAIDVIYKSDSKRIFLLRIHSLSRYLSTQKALREAMRSPNNAVHYRWLSTMFSETDEMLLLLDDENNILQTNPSVTRNLGYESFELEGKSIYSVLKLRPDNRQSFFQSTIQYTFDEDPDRFKGLVDGAGIPIAVIDVDTIGVEGAIFYSNSRFDQLLGVENGSLQGAPIYELLNQDSSNRLRVFVADTPHNRLISDDEGYAWITQSGLPATTTLSILRIRGKGRDHLILLVWPEESAHQHEMFYSNELGKMILSKDDFDKKLLTTVGERLEALEDHSFDVLCSILCGSPIAVLHVGTESGTIHQANTAALQLFDAESDDFIGQSVDLLVPESVRTHHPAFRKAFTQKPQTRPMGEGRMLPLETRSGELRQAEISLFPLSFQKRFNEEVVLVLLRPESLDIDWNLLQLTTFGQLFVEDKQRAHEHAVLAKSGAVIPVTAHGVSLHGLYGHKNAFGIIMRDISKMKESGRKNQYDAFQSGMSEMSTFVLHNIGNAMQGVTTNFDNLTEKFKNVDQILGILKMLESEMKGSDPELAVAAEQKLKRALPILIKLLSGVIKDDKGVNAFKGIKESVNHVLDILTTQHRNIRVKTQNEPFELFELVQDIGTISSTVLNKHDIQLIVELPKLPKFHVSRNHLLQALLNLVKNAQESIVERIEDNRKKSGGVARGVISVYAEMVNPADFEHSQVRIVVKDNGRGMDLDTLERSVQMGFTTKSGGSGVGLHSVAIYAGLMGGELKVESGGLNQGAIVTLAMSISDEER